MDSTVTIKDVAALAGCLRGHDVPGPVRQPLHLPRRP